MAELYDTLRAAMPSPVVDLNRAVAHSWLRPEGWPEARRRDRAGRACRNYAPLPAARGDFLFRAGRLAKQGHSKVLPGSPATRSEEGILFSRCGGLRRLS